MPPPNLFLLISTLLCRSCGAPAQLADSLLDQGSSLLEKRKLSREVSKMLSFLFSPLLISRLSGRHKNVVGEKNFTAVRETLPSLRGSSLTGQGRIAAKFSWKSVIEELVSYPPIAACPELGTCHSHLKKAQVLRPGWLSCLNNCLRIRS